MIAWLEVVLSFVAGILGGLDWLVFVKATSGRIDSIPLFSVFAGIFSPLFFGAVYGTLRWKNFDLPSVALGWVMSSIVVQIALSLLNDPASLHQGLHLDSKAGIRIAVFAIAGVVGTTYGVRNRAKTNA